jgi:hypothetical protein
VIHKLGTPTLNGSLSVLKAIPGTYLSQTGNPLHMKKNNFHLEQCLILFFAYIMLTNILMNMIKIITQSSIQHKRRDRYASEHKGQLVVLA